MDTRTFDRLKKEFIEETIKLGDTFSDLLYKLYIDKFWNEINVTQTQTIKINILLDKLEIKEYIEVFLEYYNQQGNSREIRIWKDESGIISFYIHDDEYMGVVVRDEMNKYLQENIMDFTTGLSNPLKYSFEQFIEYFNEVVESLTYIENLHKFLKRYSVEELENMEKSKIEKSIKKLGINFSKHF